MEIGAGLIAIQERDARERTAYDRFREHINPNPDPVTGCIEWRGETDEHGYGVFWNGVAREQVHVFAYRHVLLEAKQLPRGTVVVHDCQNIRCIRLDHLRAE